MSYEYDFRDGLRVIIPPGKKLKIDMMIDNIVMQGGEVDTTSGEPFVAMTNIKYNVNWAVAIYEDGKREDIKPVRDDKDVLIIVPGGGLGDNIAWLSYSVLYQNHHQCKSLTIAASPKVYELFENQYPGITFIDNAPFETVTPDNFDELFKNYPVVFRLGCFFGDDGRFFCPVDHKLTGLHHIAGYVLDIPRGDYPLELSPEIYEIHPENQVTFDHNGSAVVKTWLRPNAWGELAVRLGDTKMVGIGRERDKIVAWWVNRFPENCVDDTGDKPLADRCRGIRKSRCYVGGSSGLAWLAWCCKTPVVMVGGWTNPVNEFECDHVINWAMCNSCWNDTHGGKAFDHGDGFQCPRHRGDMCQFICSWSITVDMVFDAVKKYL